MDKVNIFSLPNDSRPYYCTNCGHFKLISTNHTSSCLDYCEGCSWKPSFGDPNNRFPMFGRTYRMFMYTEDSMETTTLNLYLVGLRERGHNITDVPQPYWQSVAAYIRERNNRDVGDLLEVAAFMLKDIDSLMEMLEEMRRYMQPAIQDGADFYVDGKLLASYGSLIKDDFDTEGIAAARHQFLTEHPGYYFESKRKPPRPAREMKTNKITN